MRTTTLILPVIVLLAACDEILSPRRTLSPADAVAARTTSSVNAAAVSAVQIDVSWPDNVRNEAGWEVHRSTSGSAGAYTALASVGPNVVTYSNTGLAGLTEYCYKVRSFTTAGNKFHYTGFSSIACGRTLGPPSAVNAVPKGSTAVDLTWADNADNENGFRVERSPTASGPWQGAAKLTANTVKFTDFARAADQQVCYRVVAVYPEGDAPSDADCTVPPRAPREVTAVADSRKITVRWVDASVAEDGFELERSREGIWSVLAALPANTASYDDAAVVADIRYSYRLRARRDGGYSDYTASAFAAVPSGPPPAPGIGNAPAGSTVALIFWPSVSANTATIRVERSRDGVSGWEAAGSARVSDDGFRDTGRTPEQQICHRAFASNLLGESGPSNVDCTILIAQPTDLTIHDNEDGTSTVKWKDNSQHETAYLVPVMYCLGWSCQLLYDQWLEPNSTEFTFFVDYNVQIAGVWACGDEGCSDAATSEASAGGAIPATIAGGAVLRSFKTGIEPPAVSGRPTRRSPCCAPPWRYRTGIPAPTAQP